jgi:ArsR family transcriptional regulator, arsenate/arsenite/antimonite-responsive transcriptional repressor
VDQTTAVTRFSALAHQTRLSVFRLLVEAGPEGLAAGDISRRLAMPHNTLSTHLAVLARAGLVESRRDGRSIIYAARFSGVRELIDFVLRDCCKGLPKVCSPLLATGGRAFPIAEKVPSDA